MEDHNNDKNEEQLLPHGDLPAADTPKEQNREAAIRRLKLRYCSEGGYPRANLMATNWLSNISGSSDFDTVEVSFKNTRVGFYINPQGLDLKIGDIVAVDGNPGHDIGRVSMTGRLVKLQMRRSGVKDETELKQVFRIATQADLEKFEQARSREHDTMIGARKIAEELQLNMKIGDVEYQGDGGKAIFYYIADERVDFRKLIRILADTFKVRIEMKQIGARQEAGRIGGIGTCGRPLCCASWMTHFVSVSTGAARMQDLSMNPQKLAGQCGKLKCCLNFETDIYAEAQKKLPPRDAVLQTHDSDYYWFKPDILAGTITYSTDKRIPANLVTISAERAFEIMDLNARGTKVESLLREEDIVAEEKPLDLVEQESLTRFDKSRRKKKKGKQQKSERTEPGNQHQEKHHNRHQHHDKPQQQEKTQPHQEKRGGRGERRERYYHRGQHQPKPKSEGE